MSLIRHSRARYSYPGNKIQINNKNERRIGQCRLTNWLCHTSSCCACPPVLPACLKKGTSKAAQKLHDVHTTCRETRKKSTAVERASERNVAKTSTATPTAEQKAGKKNTQALTHGWTQGRTALVRSLCQPVCWWLRRRQSQSCSPFAHARSPERSLICCSVSGETRPCHAAVLFATKMTSSGWRTSAGDRPMCQRTISKTTWVRVPRR